MVNGKTSTGFEFTVDERKAKDWELIEIVADMQKADNDMHVYASVISVINFLIGEDQKERLKEHCRRLYGYADAEQITKEVFEIVGAARTAPETKNSSSSPVALQPTRMPSSVISPNTTASMITGPFQQATRPPYAQDSGTGAGLYSPSQEAAPTAM